MDTEVEIRKLQPRDKEAVEQLLAKIHQFTDEEKKCAVELLDIYLEQGESSPCVQGLDEGPKDYEFLVAVDRRDTLCGFASFGNIPLTDGCYDLYWIVSDPAMQNSGIGTKLLNRLEEILKERGVRKLFAETSSQENYTSARSFYIKRGFKLIARMPDFYKVGDDKLVYVKTLISADLNADDR